MENRSRVAICTGSSLLPVCSCDKISYASSSYHRTTLPWWACEPGQPFVWVLISSKQPEKKQRQEDTENSTQNILRRILI